MLQGKISSSNRTAVNLTAFGTEAVMSAESLCCKRCGASDYVKSGMVRGHQRYRCHGCGCNFTATPRRGKPSAMKALAVLLYGMGNMSFSMIKTCKRTWHFLIKDPKRIRSLGVCRWACVNV
jgi:transposase-like protein